VLKQQCRGSPADILLWADGPPRYARILFLLHSLASPYTANRLSFSVRTACNFTGALTIYLLNLLLCLSSPPLAWQYRVHSPSCLPSPTYRLFPPPTSLVGRRDVTHGDFAGAFCAADSGTVWFAFCVSYDDTSGSFADDLRYLPRNPTNLFRTTRIFPTYIPTTPVFTLVVAWCGMLRTHTRGLRAPPRYATVPGRALRLVARYYSLCNGPLLPQRDGRGGTACWWRVAPHINPYHVARRWRDAYKANDADAHGNATAPAGTFSHYRAPFHAAPTILPPPPAVLAPP